MKPAEEIRQLRQQILDDPQLFLGNKEPDIRALWGYIRALSDSLDIVLGRNPALWAIYLQKVAKVGGRGEYQSVVSQHTDWTYQDRLTRMREIVEGYEPWVKTQ